MVGPSGRPPISEGANTGSKKNVETLVAHGADQEQKAAAYNDATPLTIAAIGRHHEVVAYLIKVTLGYQKSGWLCFIVV